MTERATYRFTVKEGAEGQPSLMLEPMHGSLLVLGRGFLSLDLASGTTLEEAQSLATELNQRVRSVAYTR